MPGILGLAGRPSHGEIAAPLADMAARMRAQPWYVEQRHADDAHGVGLGRVGLGFIEPAPQPAFSDDGACAAVFDGELYDLDEQRQALGAPAGTGAAALVLRGYLAGGARFLAGLHGKFVAAVWDGRARQLALINDRFGMRNLYYAQAGGRLLFASEVKALLAQPGVSRRPHLPGVAQFFTYGHLMAEDTFYEGVRLLPAAGLLIYDADADRVRLERYWKLEEVPATAPGTRAEVLDRIAAAFDLAMARHAAGPYPLGLSLSGGLDARTLLGAMPRDRLVQTVSLGVEGSMDVRCAAEMARLAGQPNHPIILDDRFLSRFGDHMRDMVQLTDGHYLSQCIVMPTLPRYRELGIEVLLRGHAGELMHLGKAYNFSHDAALLAARDDDAVEAWLLARVQAYMVEGTGGRLFSPAINGQMAELARESLRTMLAPYRGLMPPAQQASRLFLAMRTRRETAMSLVKFGALVETRLPYLDNELVEAVLSAPLEMKLDEEIQAHILQRRRPEFLAVPNVNTGAPMRAGALRRLFAGARQKVLAKLGVKGYQHYEKLGIWLRRELKPLVAELLLSPRCLDRGLFEPQAVRDAVARHTNGTANHTYLLLALMIYEVGQRTFVDGDGAAARRPALVAER